MKNLIFICILFILCGCQKDPEPRILVDVRGYKYKLIQETQIKGPLIYLELWERIEPKDTNHYYSRTLESETFNSQIPIFFPVSR